MRRCDVELCEELNVDILGFVVEYPREVPWNLTRRQAKELISATRRPACIVTGGMPENILSLVRELSPAMVQLHFRETVEQTAMISAELKKSGIKTIRAVDSESDIAALCETDIHAILVDSRTAENAAESTKTVDVGLFSRIKTQSAKPLIIAGGITPENVGDIISRTGADWIDVMTGVEHSPGVKGRTKMETLVEHIMAI
jgi:phosphoribosylanthranilate isomerase